MFATLKIIALVTAVTVLAILKSCGPSTTTVRVAQKTASEYLCGYNEETNQPLLCQKLQFELETCIDDTCSWSWKDVDSNTYMKYNKGDIYP